MEFPHVDRKWLLGGLGVLVVVWLLMRQQKNTAAPSSGTTVVQPAYDPNAAALNAQLQAAQIQSQQGIAAVNAQAAAAVQVAQVTSQAQTAQIVAQSQAALGIAQAGYSAQTQQTMVVADASTMQAKYNADAAVALQNGINTADVAKTISTNETAVQMYGIQAGVAHDAISSASNIDLASIAATHSENLATIQAQSDAYQASLPIALKAQQDQQDRFNTLATIFSSGKLIHAGETGANQLAGFLGLVNPSAVPTVALGNATFGVASENNKGTVLNSIFSGIAKVANAVL